ncbi:Hypothetical protein NTJ_05215 [Nesidiocoris tenuis]|uniref:Uncharacterized protein n=1 Tax=Nesidiocoris tenuis TaxID=355587 RepID=A0ABN7AJH9_9HEMI|nr:Hypothetical protein NTJ_05215 [Nesidiocoris tenuis]
MTDPVGKREGPVIVENPYVYNELGFVSHEAADSYCRFMKKYENVDSEHFVKPPTNKEIEALKVLKDLKKKKTIRKRRRTVSQEFVNDDDDEDEDLPKKHTVKQVIKVKVGKPSKENATENTGSNSEVGTRKRENSVCKRPQIRPPMTYEELLKLAERNLRESFMAEISRTQDERPMTKKEKLSYVAKIKEANNRKQSMVRT